ncbi:conserved hypothetical protein [Thiolapillus brandeum]|uniref:Xcc1710-like domain-containing protein n=2 Tax=Thiolapillus brandeum TaxID=1076588 RepID=A0A7U6JHQ2_9GAMM|nr:conserved hypothetical protein [Thiolapillus brandeum]
MKFAQDHINSKYVIEACEPGRIQVASQIFSHNMLIMPERLLQPWEVTSMDELSTRQLHALATHEPDVIILGTGQHQVFPHPSLFKPLMQAGIGWEVMPTDAACRTYNILHGEDRRVLAALIL